MIHLRQELPYTVATAGNRMGRARKAMKNRSTSEPRSGSSVWVTGPIVIGRGGRMIREIGITARKQLEVFLDTKVFLDLEVVVHRDWREDPEAKLTGTGL